MTEFEELRQEVDNGLLDLNRGIPIGMGRLDQHASIRKRIFTLLFSSSGAGKSSFLTTVMLNAIEWHIANKPKQELKFLFFSMERSKKYQIAKWVIRKIFADHGEAIPIGKLLGWTEEKMTKDQHDLFLMYEDYINRIFEDYVTLYEGAKTPNEIRHILKEFYKANGKYEDINEFKKIYIPNNEQLITVPMIDHGNLTKKVKDMNKKQSIDLLVEYMQSFRDLEGASPWWIGQANRTLSGLAGNKDSEAEPSVDHLKESSDVVDAADLIMALFDPLKYKQSSKTGYNPNDFLDKNSGANYFRSVQILKSSFGADSLRYGTAFNGFCGDFKILPKRTDLSDQQYINLCKDVINRSYFLS